MILNLKVPEKTWMGDLLNPDLDLYLAKSLHEYERILSFMKERGMLAEEARNSEEAQGHIDFYYRLEALGYKTPRQIKYALEKGQVPEKVLEDIVNAGLRTLYPSWLIEVIKRTYVDSSFLSPGSTERFNELYSQIQRDNAIEIRRAQLEKK